MISVIIPTYKRSDYLVRCIDSVLNQTYKDIQVIVVDDNNPNTEYREETENKMKKYDNDSRVKYIKHDKNRNGSAARNTGIKNSNGEYLCFLDDDDYYLSNKIEEQINYLKCYTNYDACYCDYKRLNKNIIVDLKCDFTKDILLHKPTPQTSGWLIKRIVVEKLKGFDESFYRHQDYEFLLRFYKFGFKMGKVNKVLYCRELTNVVNEPYGIRNENLKNQFLNIFEDIINLYDDKFKQFVFIKNYSIVFEGYIRIFDFANSVRIINKMFSINFFMTCSYLLLDFMKKSYKKLIITFVKKSGKR